MYLFLHEMKRNRLSLIIWTVCVSFLLSVSILIYPEMAGEMEQMSDMFANMGSFTQAFGMDKLNFGEFMGYFAVECGNQLGLGGAMFASILGASALAKEERDKTAEFLLTHPVSRSKIVLSKYLALLLQITIFTLGVALCCLLSILVIGESPDLKAILLLFLAYLLLEIEICSVTFGISAFIRGGGMAIGLGVGLLFYFIGILSNLIEQTKFLKYFTPFAFADGGTIVNEHIIKGEYLAVGGLFTAIGIILAFIKYKKKDIH